jgi:hypothetical protein
MQSWLTRQLLTTAEAQRALPSPFLRTRILAAIDRSQSNEPVAGWEHWWLRLGVRFGAVATFFAAFVIAAVVWRQHTPPPRAAVQQPAPSAVTPALLENLTGRLSRADGQKLLEWSQSLEQPLDQELQSLVNDAKSALGSLARNFLPDNVPTLPDISSGPNPDR